MIPLKDNIASIRFPAVVWVLFALNLLVFLFEQTLSEGQLLGVVHLYGVVPARLFDQQFTEMAGYPPGGLSTLVTYMFLHSGWLHFLMNMWVLWIFADNLEDALGHARFAVFYLVCGVVGAGLHALVHPDSQAPVIGASGAIAGVMGGYFRLFPHARVVVLIPIIIIPWIVEVPSVLFLGVWFFSQILSVFSDSGLAEEGGTVAWWAHMGGFLCGFLLIRAMGALDCRYCFSRENRAYRRG